MSDYEKFVTEVNNIFSKLEKLKKSWVDSDNLDFIEEINKHKNAVISGASFLQEQGSNKSADKEML